MTHISIYDTTLRDGTQAEDLHLSTEDKVRIAQKLDDLGIAYIEGGWPVSNPTDQQFFKEIKNYDLKHARVTCFGSTHNPKQTPDKDPNLKSVIQAKTDVITLFGKTWDIHVKEALRTTLEHNLEIISGSLAFVRPEVRELFFDAEHFFDGFKAQPDYALLCLRKAWEAGADVLVLCDTNGGCLPHEVGEIVAQVQKELPGAKLGIHTHNDSETAVASSLIAVRNGAVQVQGTMNGYGERCGNANLCSVIPNLQLKMGCTCLPEGHLELLASTSHFVSEVANLKPFLRQPFVGNSAFAHKGGIHVSAVTRNPRTYEHIEPELVGNKQRVLLSDLAGRSNILFKAKQFGFHLEKDDPFVSELLAEIKTRESKGYEYAAAEASFELLLNQTLGRMRRYFSLLSFRVIDARHEDQAQPWAEATVMIKVGGVVEHTAAAGHGPVNALDHALRKALERFYPNLKEMRLLDFKVRVLSAQNGNSGTASNVRVLIESGDAQSRWITVGVSHNIIEASWQALEDSMNYKLFKDDQHKLQRITTDK
ncbi:(R)-citramalate synthase [Desulfonatronum thiosulfatophilum]|uniref:Citramalate synthase n=1 Tax=Desulfonatronum thiosulfatophilum TaxID=617002 RepID=A0A1G6DD53_9BACT|nr:citramalate synthase [Desulfonatronum thiosulfatophilum]SDB43060.1 (R)-citramalate synthase [Desulfonatronum thiosulfatophilum]